MGSTCRPRSSGWTRAADTACASVWPPSIIRISTSTIDERIRSDPPVPSARTPPSGATRIEGLIIDPIRWPGGVAWNPSGLRSASPSMLFSWIPVPGMTKPEVTPFDVVMEATIPSASTALTCVVPVAVSGAVAPPRRWIVAATRVSTSPIQPRASSRVEPRARPRSCRR